MVPSTEGWIEIHKINEVAKKPTPLLTPDELLALPDTDAVLTVAYPLRYVGALEVVPTLQQLASGPANSAIISLEKANVVLITDYATNLRRLVTILSIVDDPSNAPNVRVFALQYADAATLAGLLNRILRAEATASGSAKAVQQLNIDFDAGTNSLVILAPPSTLGRVETLVASLDIKPEARQRNIRFYQLKNAKAEDVANTLGQLTSQQPSGIRVVPGARQPGTPGAVGIPASIGQIGEAQVKIIGDEGTNSIIVMAPSEVQTEVENLILELDRRKAQVLIEALVVQVSATRNFNLGVELQKSWGSQTEYHGTAGTGFGLSTVDPDTGARTVAIGEGLTGTLLKNDEIRLILRALLVENNGQIISRPRLLVNDNKEATFKSLDEQPYTQLNAVTTNTTSTTLGGYAEAGTTLTITPHISEGNYLTLDMSLDISQFTGTGSADLPPPKRSDNVKSTVTIPNASTIIIGGLSGYHITRGEHKVPLLGDIPLVGWLFKTHTTNRDDTTEYIFIKALLATDEDFADLRGLSEQPRSASQRLQDEHVPLLPEIELPSKDGEGSREAAQPGMESDGASEYMPGEPAAASPVPGVSPEE